MNKKKNIGLFIGLAGALLMVISLFLPYAERGQESKSLIGMAQAYLSSSASDWNNAAMESFYKVFVPGIVGLMAVFVILYIIMNIKLKPVAMIVFNVLIIGVYVLLKWDFKDRRVVPGACDKGIAFTVIYIALRIMLVGSVKRFIDKKKLK